VIWGFSPRCTPLLLPFAMSKRGKQADFKAKTVMLGGRRYIVCRNHQEAEKDAPIAPDPGRAGASPRQG
jgi:hypothetical protein